MRNEGSREGPQPMDTLGLDFQNNKVAGGGRLLATFDLHLV